MAWRKEKKSSYPEREVIFSRHTITRIQSQSTFLVDIVKNMGGIKKLFIIVVTTRAKKGPNNHQVALVNHKSEAIVCVENR